MSEFRAIPEMLDEGEPEDGAVQEVDDSDGGTTASVYLPPFRIDVTVRSGVAQLVSRHRLVSDRRAVGVSLMPVSNPADFSPALK